MPPRGFDRDLPPWRDDPLIAALTDDELDALADVLLGLARAFGRRLADDDAADPLLPAAGE